VEIITERRLAAPEITCGPRGVVEPKDLAPRALAVGDIAHAGGDVARGAGRGACDIVPGRAVRDVREGDVEGTALRDADLAHAAGHAGDAVGRGRSAVAAVAGEAVAAVSCGVAARRAPSALAVVAPLSVAAIEGCLASCGPIEASVLLAPLGLAAVAVEEAQRG
jgi:hypothetical protein